MSESVRVQSARSGVQRAEERLRELEHEIRRLNQTAIPDARQAIGAAHIELFFAEAEQFPCSYPGCGAGVNEPCRDEGPPGRFVHTARGLDHRTIPEPDSPKEET